MKKIITFGEIMMRFSPTDRTDIKRATTFETCFGGSEANVAYDLASYGVPSAFVSILPNNPLGKAAVEALYHKNLDTETIRFSDQGRLGLYFLEKDYKHLTRKCYYDRANSSFALSKREDYDWKEILKDASIFHFSGITPALSKEMPSICEDACVAAKELGISVSIDINYRNQLWDKETASSILLPLCRYADILFINEDEFSLFGFDTGIMNHPLLFADAAEQICSFFGAETICSAERLFIDSKNIKIRSMIYQLRGNRVFLSVAEHPAVPLELSGAGDAYAAAMLYALKYKKMSAKKAVNFATTACAFKHSCKGDFMKIKA